MLFLAINSAKMFYIKSNMARYVFCTLCFMHVTFYARYYALCFMHVKFCKNKQFYNTNYFCNTITTKQLITLIHNIKKHHSLYVQLCYKPTGKLYTTSKVRVAKSTTPHIHKITKIDLQYQANFTTKG